MRDPKKSTSSQKNRMAKNEFHAKWNRIHDLHEEGRKQAYAEEAREKQGK